MISLRKFFNKYRVDNVSDKFIQAMDNSVAPILLAAWSVGTPVTGLLGPALAMPPGSLVVMPFLEVDLTKTLAAIAIGVPPPGVPAIVPPTSPVMMLTLASLNPSATTQAIALANAIVDWACAQAPLSPPVAKGPPTPWPPPFVAV
jgi:hypothetical protein